MVCSTRSRCRSHIYAQKQNTRMEKSTLNVAHFDCSFKFVSVLMLLFFFSVFVSYIQTCFDSGFMFCYVLFVFIFFFVVGRLLDLICFGTLLMVNWLFAYTRCCCCRRRFFCVCSVGCCYILLGCANYQTCTECTY